MNKKIDRKSHSFYRNHTVPARDITAEDKLWFEQHPERRFQIRRMTATEIETCNSIGAREPLPVGMAWFLLMCKLAPDVRIWTGIHGPAHSSGREFSEELASVLWDQHLARSPIARRSVAQFAAIVRDRDQKCGGAA